MKKKLPTLFLVLSLIVTLFAGCDTDQGGLAPSTDSELTEDGQPASESGIVPSEEPDITEEPAATTAPTNLPNVTEAPLPTEAPEPTATPKPTATPAVSEITVNAKKVADFNTYSCSERGEEAKAIVLQLREQQPRLRGTKPMMNELKTNYDFSEEDILWAVYTSGWPEEALHYANSIIKNHDFSRLLLLDSLNDDFSYIESDVRYALDNCTANWKQEAIDRTKWLLDQEFGMSYVRLVESLKLRLFTDEDIEYALANLTIDWVAEAEEASHDILNTGGLSRQEVIRNLVLRKFSTEQALSAVERLDVDWEEKEKEWLASIILKDVTSYTVPDRK